MKKKNLLIVSPYFYPEGGGLENYAFQVGKRLLEKYTVFALCATRKEAGADIIDGIQIRRVLPDFFVSNTPIKLGLSKIITALIEKEGIDIIHGHMPVPYFADIAARVAHKKKIPFVLTFHATELKKGTYTDIIETFYRPLLHKTFSLSSRVVAVTKKGRDNILSGVDDVAVISPGVEAVIDTVHKSREKSFVFAGQLSKAHELKGLKFLIEAFSKVNGNSVLYIAGDGGMRAEYEELAQHFGISDRCVFLGWIDRDEMLTYVEKSLALVIPSINDSEGFPTVMPEAFSRGTALIGSRVGGIPEMITEGETGVLVPPGDVFELSKVLNWALLHEKEMVEMGMKGREIVIKDFTWDAISKRYTDLYEKIL